MNDINDMKYEAKIILQNAVTAFEKETNLKIQLNDQQNELTTRGPGYDTILRIPVSDRLIAFHVVIKKIDRFHILNTLQEKNNILNPMLLIVPYVTREIAAKCRSLGIQFIDTAGNAYINVPGLLINMVGKPRPLETRDILERKAITPAGMRVIFALLTRPKLVSANYREIARASGVSLGMVVGVIANLENRGFLSKNNTNENERRIIDTHRLIDEWVSFYPSVLRPKLHVRRFSAKMLDWWQNVQFDPEKAVWGGEAAASKLTRNFNPAIITLYVSQTPEDIIINNHLQLDINGNIEILEMFWKNGIEINTNYEGRGTAHPLLVYADLMATADSRDREIAKQIYDQYLANINN